jgi:hypothetical protein
VKQFERLVENYAAQFGGKDREEVNTSAMLRSRGW